VTKRTDYILTIGQVVDAILKDNDLVFEADCGVMEIAYHNGFIYWMYKQRGRPKEKLNPCLVHQNKRFRIKIKEYKVKGFTSGFIKSGEPLTVHDINNLMIKDFKKVKTTKNDIEIEIFLREV